LFMSSGGLKREEKEKMKFLSDLLPGDRGVVVRVEGDPGLKAKVLALGLVPGTELRIERRAPLNDPISVRVRGFELSLRRSEAEIVKVRDLPTGCAGCGCCGGC
jgi:ferrous iron transport protein A